MEPTVAAAASFSSEEQTEAPPSDGDDDDDKVALPWFQKENSIQINNDDLTTTLTDSRLSLILPERIVRESNVLFNSIGWQVTGLLLSAALIVGLAVTTDGSVSDVWNAILEATLPVDMADVRDIVLSEGVAGVAGAAVTYGLRVGLVRVFSLRATNHEDSQQQNDETKVVDTRNNGQEEEEAAAAAKASTRLLSESVAEGDYFVARAAAIPFLNAAGLSDPLITIVATLAAYIPSEATKGLLRSKIQQDQEETALDELLEEQQEKERLLSRKWGLLYGLYSTAMTKPKVVDTDQLKPIPSEEVPIDVVEIFSDLLKWLEFAVLQDYSGGMFGGEQFAEGALFGSLSSTSAQLYADVLSLYFRLGSSIRREQIVDRTIRDWASLYTERCLSGAVLFGLYTALQRPDIPTDG